MNVMMLNIRMEGDVAILSNFARVMNDPRYVDATRDVQTLIDEGVSRFVIELAGIRSSVSLNSTTWRRSRARRAMI